jgi:glycerophosphoryl diester phosphodiesterase family protein
MTSCGIFVATALAAVGAIRAERAAAIPPTIEPPQQCLETPESQRWFDAGTPDTGVDVPLIMPHRGGGYLAPEETIDAYKVSLAYGSDGFEGDVRVAKDGTYVLSHDETTARLAANGAAGTPDDIAITAATVKDLKQLNMANHADFALSAPANAKQAYNPARILTLGEALQLANDYSVGMDLDIKAVPDVRALADFAAQWPVAFSRTFFEADPWEVVLMRSAQPSVNAMYNIGGDEPPGTMYALTQAPYFYRYFGSALAKFTPERVAEIHDGCARAIPHDYDGYEDGNADEPRALREGRENGTDGAQVNHVEIATATWGRPVRTLVEFRGQGSGLEACLVNADRQPLGLPYKHLTVGKRSLLTLREGCAPVPADVCEGATVSYAGDEQALASSAVLGRGHDRSRRSVRRCARDT